MEEHFAGRYADEISFRSIIQPVDWQVETVGDDFSGVTNHGRFRGQEIGINIFGALSGAEKQYERCATDDKDLGALMATLEFVGEGSKRAFDVIGRQRHGRTLAVKGSRVERGGR